MSTNGEIDGIVDLLVLGSAVGVPENEGAGVDLVETDRIFGTPPPTYDDLIAREDDALIGPESIEVDVVVLIFEVLHHGHALEAWNAFLGW